MFSSIQKKLLAYILAVTTLFLAGIGLLNYMWAEKYLVEVSETRAAAMAESAAARIDSYLLQKGQFAWTMSQDENIHCFVKRLNSRYQNVSTDEDYQKMLISFKRIVAEDPDINIAYIAIAKTQRVYDSTEGEIPPDYMASSRPWYKAAVKNKGLVFSSPYICPVTGKHVVSAAVPFYDGDGSLLGVAAVEILVNKIENIVSGLHLFNSGYSFLLDEQGQAIIYPSQRHLAMIQRSMGSGEEVGELVAQMTKSETGWQQITTDGVEKYVFYSPIEQVGWSLGVVVPTAEVTDTIVPLGRISLVTVLLGLTIISLCILLLTARITRPLKEFTAIMCKVAEGDYTVRARVISRDEIGKLGESLNHMLDKQQHLIKEVMDTAYNMGIAGHKLAITIGEGRSTIPEVTTEISRIVKKLNLGTVKEKSTAFGHSQATRGLFEQIILLNYEHRALLGSVEELETDFTRLQQITEDEEQSRYLEKLSQAYYYISERLVNLSQQADDIQMSYVDVDDYIDELHQNINDILNTLQIVNIQIRNVAALQSEVLNHATKTALGLVEWSQALIELTSRFQIPDNPAD